MKKVRILLVDDQSEFREALRLLLSLQPDFEVVGETRSGETALRYAATSALDVILMDLRMPGMGGIEATRRLTASKNPARIIVLTTFEEDDEVRSALRSGACGYLLKAGAPEKISEAIRVAFRGQSPLDPAIAKTLIADLQRPQIEVHSSRERISGNPLSAREHEVLRCLAEGLSNKEIGGRLEIAEGTVKNHMSQVLSKLGVLDRTQAALLARKLDWI